MTDLTEQWKKGELPSGWYYLKVNEELANYPVIAECVVDYSLELPFSYFYEFDEAKIEKVLAQVPSYEEWKKSYECVVSENEEIVTLKELLKKCRDELDVAFGIGAENLVYEIDEVLKWDE